MLSKSDIDQLIAQIRADIQKGAEGLEFEPATHTYTYCGKVLPPVSDVCKIFERGFDSDYWSKQKAAESGLTPEQVLAKWKANSQRACEEGTEVHAYAEWQFYRATGQPCDDPEIVAIADAIAQGRIAKDARMRCVDEVWELLASVPGLYPVASENRIVNPELGYAGTFDLLCLRVNPDDTYGLVIFDYKTNANLFNVYRPRYGNLDTLCHTLAHITACNAANYSCQLCLYQLGLERATAVPVIDRVLLWVEPEGVAAIHENTTQGYYAAHRSQESRGKKSKWRYFAYYVKEISALKHHYSFARRNHFATLHLPDLRLHIRQHLASTKV